MLSNYFLRRPIFAAVLSLLFVISGAKERNPAAAMALIERLSPH